MIPSTPAAALQSTEGIAGPPPWRSQALSLATVGYVVALALWVGGGQEPAGWIFGLAAMSFALYACRRPARLTRTWGWGLAVVVASLGGGHDPSRSLDACGAFGVAVCAMCAAVSMVRAPCDGGLVRAPPVSPLPAAVALGALWAIAIVVALVPARAVAQSSFAWLIERPEDWALGVSAASALVLLVVAERLRHRRRLELGIGERALAVRALLGTAFAAELLAAPLAQAPAYVSARVVLALVAVAVAATASARDSVRAARATRRFVVLAIVGGGVAMLGATAAAGRGLGAWDVTLVTAAGTLLVGAATSVLEAPMRPSQGTWLDAFARARDAAAAADPEEAIRGALVALCAPSGGMSASTELWTFPPARSLTVDAAGYLHEREAELPELLAHIAAAEPESTVRTEVLDALEVRRPELRPLARWMNDRSVLFATLIEFEGEAEGVLVVPRAFRTTTEPPTLEEVRALKAVADRLAGPCRARATRARLLARAHEATQRAEIAEEAADRLRHLRALDVGRDALAAMRLARPATVGVYAASSKMALEALERRTSVGGPIAVVAPSGVDPVPYLARAHLAGTRRDAPLVLVDATSAREHDTARWCDPQVSPLALADRGMLVLLDGGALPAEVQRLVASALAQKQAPWERPEPLDVQLALTGVASPEALVEQGRLDASLALRLGDSRSSPVALPRLRERPEDLRAILTDRLAREGLRVQGRPVGIEQAAYARLVEYPFPGEDAELATVVQRLVARCRGDVVRASDVDALRLTGESARGRRKDPLSA
jgi:hypothetical protein